MQHYKRGQISVEYLVIAGFVMMLVIGVLGAGLVYSSRLQTDVNLNQLSTFANKVIQSSETVYYSGEPSRVSITAYLPNGISAIQVSGTDMVFTVSTSTGRDTVSFTSSVPLELSGTPTTTSGVKRFELRALSDRVQIIPR